MGHLTTAQRYEVSLILRNPSSPYSQLSTPHYSTEPTKRSRLYLPSRRSSCSKPATICRLHETLNSNLLLSLYTRVVELIDPDPSHQFLPSSTTSSGSPVPSKSITLATTLTHQLSRIHTLLQHHQCEGCALARLLNDCEALHALRAACYVYKPDGGGRLMPWVRIWIELKEKEKEFPYFTAAEVGRGGDVATGPIISGCTGPAGLEGCRTTHSQHGGRRRTKERRNRGLQLGSSGRENLLEFADTDTRLCELPYNHHSSNQHVTNIINTETAPAASLPAPHFPGANVAQTQQPPLEILELDTSGRVSAYERLPELDSTGIIPSADTDPSSSQFLLCELPGTTGHAPSSTLHDLLGTVRLNR